uniref:Uncharacterized protein n=1 Tax=Meloidogyne hapla TaxID=6305 RepID=A0A1I8B4U9_MELHA
MVYDWRSLFRDQPFMGGNGEICQIDEILLRGKRKNNKGRMTIGDEEGKESKAIKIGDINFDEEEAEEYEEHKNMINYGSRVDDLGYLEFHGIE